jgi:hypothetical protein
VFLKCAEDMLINTAVEKYVIVCLYEKGSKDNVAIVKKYHCYQLHTQFYASFSSEVNFTKMKLFGSH